MGGQVRFHVGTSTSGIHFLLSTQVEISICTEKQRHRNHGHIRGLEQGRSKQKGDKLSGAISVPADASLKGITFICLNRPPHITGENSTWGQGASNGAIYSNKNIWEGNIAELVQRTNGISYPYPFSTTRWVSGQVSNFSVPDEKCRRTSFSPYLKRA